jgi:hypothetical protein
MQSISPKVALTAIVGSIITVLVWVVKAVWKIDIPGEVAAALTTIFGALAGYFAPHANPPQPG